MDGARLRAALLIAGLGSILVLVSALGDAGRFTFLGLVAVSAALTRAAQPGPASGAPNWWRLIAAGMVLLAIGAPLALLTSSPGGLLAVTGAALALVGVVLGMPAKASAR